VRERGGSCSLCGVVFSIICLTIATEGDSVVASPGGSSRGSVLVMAMAAIQQASRVASCRRQPSHLSVLHCRLANPVHSWVLSYDLVVRIHHDHLEEFECRILIDPIRVEDTEVGAATSHTLLCDLSEVYASLHLVDSLALGLSVHDAFRDGLLSASSSHSDSNDDEALLGFVPQSTSFVWSSRSRRSVYHFSLSVFPASNSKKESKDVRLLSSVELLKIFISTHKL